MIEFLERLMEEQPVDLKQLGVQTILFNEAIKYLKQAYDIS